MLFLCLLNLVACLLPDRGLESGGVIVLLGGDFLATQGLGCLFGSTTATAKYFNTTRVDCEAPAGTSSVTVQYTLDGTNYASSGTFLYYPNPSITSISPSSGPDAASTDVTFEADVVESADTLTIRLAGVLKITCSYSSATNFVCTFPSYEVLKRIDKSISHEDVAIEVSRNGAEFTTLSQTYDYLIARFDLIETFTISPVHGSKDGGTVITVNLSVLPSGSVISCKFGSVYAAGTAVDSESFTCTSPSMSSSSVVSVTISLNNADYSSNGQTYRYETFSILSMSPTQGTVNGGTKVTIHADLLLPYASSLCKFGSKTADLTFISLTVATCTTPSNSSGTLDISITFNQVDWYSIGSFKYRPNESLTKVSPIYVPFCGGTQVTLEASYYESGAGQCRFAASNVKSIISTSSSTLYCYVPPHSELNNASTTTIGISSNDQDYYNTLTLAYYPEPSQFEVTPYLVMSSKSLDFSATADNILDTGLLKVMISEVSGSSVYTVDAVYVSSTSIKFSLSLSSSQTLNTGIYSVMISLNAQQYSEATDYIWVVSYPSLTSLSPQYGKPEGGLKVTITGTDFTNLDLWCKFGTEIVQGYFVNEKSVECTSPAQPADTKVKVSLSYNKVDYSDTLDFTYLSNPTFTSSTLETYNQEQALAQISVTWKYSPRLVKVGDWVISDFTYDSGLLSFYLPRASTSTKDVEITANWVEFDTGPSVTYKGECVVGSYCATNPSFVKKECEAGYYCKESDLTTPTKCIHGKLSASAGQTTCEDCPQGKLCLNQGSVEGSACPDGYLCSSSGIGRLSAATICDAGYACKGNSKSDCPELSWCGVGSAYSSLMVYLDFRTPQECHNGAVCLKNSNSLHGSRDCDEGYYCTKGKLIQCEEGYYCPVEGMSSPYLCNPGTYNKKTKATSCINCSKGYICPGPGNTFMTICPAGNICAKEGQDSFTHACPAGNYCLSGLSEVTVNSEKGPKNCPAKTYCLLGVAHNNVVDGDISHPQNCIAGSYCPAGTNSPAEYPCPEGSYCPANSDTPIKARLARYAKGQGNAIDSLCAPGSYSNSTGLASCLSCPAGYECPLDGTITPSICGKGKYRSQSSSEIYCVPCPQGTWSDNLGLKDSSECTLCPEAVICTKEGMTSLDSAEDCPEGYICKQATTSYSIFDSLCTGGFYCKSKTSKLADLGLCDPGYYCPEGTQASSVYTHPCLPGYYCPDATNAALNVEGKYSYILQANYQEVIDAKIAANIANCTASNYTAGCDGYKIPQIVECDEDLEIPDFIKASYKSLKCPEGTLSEQGAKCVGQCKTLTEELIISTINPFTGRRLETETHTDTFALKAGELGIFDFDLGSVNDAFKYKEHFSLKLQHETTTLALPEYFANYNTTKHTAFRLTVANFADTSTTLSLFFCIHNALYEPIASTLQNTALSQFHLPSRASLSTDKLFVAIVYKEDFSYVDLPYNLYDLGEPHNILIDVGLNTEWDGEVHLKSPYDDTFWLTYEVTTVSLPWLPFVMNCEYFGDHVYIYELLELMNNCTLYSEDDTVYVRPLPTTGFVPQADECDLAFKCVYAEDVRFERSGRNFWFDIDEDVTLFYLHKRPQDWSVLFERSSGSQYDSKFTNEVKDLSDEIIPVTFKPESTSGIPQTVVLTIEYFQEDSETKSIVRASVELQDYSSFSDSEKTPYTFKVKFKSMDWLQLLESYQLDLSIYSLVYVVILLLAVFIIFLVYGVHWLIARFKDPPSLHFKQFFWINTLAPVLGVFYSSIPIFVSILIIYGLHKQEALQEVGSTWENDVEEDDEALKRKANGRLGIWLMILSVIVLYLSSCVLIPKPKEEEQSDAASVESSRMLDDMAQKSSRAESTIQDNESVESSKSSVQAPKPHSEGMTEKRAQFMLVCCCTAILVTWKLELSYADIFSSNIIGFLVFFIFLDMILEYALQRFVLGEALLVAPIVASMSAINIFISMAAKDFSDFIISYATLISFLILTRLYLKPFSQWFGQQLQKFSIFLMGRSAFFEKLLKRLIEKQLIMRIKLLSVMDNEFSAPAKMEGLMDTMLTHASHKQSVFTLPFLFAFVIMFADETQIPREYEIRQSDVQYYLLFSLMVILPTLISDVWIFHILESLFNYKLYDYFTFCRFRYKTRSTKWINQPGLRLDRSILLPWRSLDQMCFSSQYYYAVTSATWGVLILAFSWSILLRNSYNFFSDPAILFMIAICAIAQLPIRKLFSFVGDFMGIWKQRAAKIFQGEEPSDESEVVKLIDEYVEENALLTKIQTNLYKSKFVKRNKEWLITNLDRLVANHISATQFMTMLYREQHMEYMQELKGEQAYEERKQQLAAAEELRHSREEESQASHMRQMKENDFLPEDIEILHNWLDQATVARRLKEHIDKIAFPGSACDECGSDVGLMLVGLIDFYDLLNNYRNSTRGLPISLNRFRAYYLSSQKMMTLCEECRILREVKSKKDPRILGVLTQIATEALKCKNIDNHIQSAVPPPARRLALKWLFEARARLLHYGKEGPQSIIQSGGRMDPSYAVSSYETFSLAVSELSGTRS